MRAIDPSLAAHLAGGATTLATCWKLTRADGAVLGFTDHDRALTFEGTTFTPESGATGAEIESTADLGVDNSEIEGALNADALSAEDLAAGRYDEARVEIWRVNWQDAGQRMLVKSGVIGEVVREGEAFRAEIRGASHALGKTRGRLYQRGCDAVLGDARCGVDASAPAYKGEGIVAAVIDAQRFLASGLSGFENGWFRSGALFWTSGANAGTRASVKAHDRNPSGDAISLWLPAGASLAVGDTFEITAGCDKRSETCKAKFSNLINFRGFHLMPGNDFAVSYPLKTGKNDGGKR